MALTETLTAAHRLRFHLAVRRRPSRPRQAQARRRGCQEGGGRRRRGRGVSALAELVTVLVLQAGHLVVGLALCCAVVYAPPMKNMIPGSYARLIRPVTCLEGGVRQEELKTFCRETARRGRRPNCARHEEGWLHS
ncbi:hypothetical protein EXIGLDRAFT_96959 [Exidia glandulosa HHB12029]|uniref:Uncharacterized protein n=1 Tax=Exidia glandulosa HHB12029 TaxID=1314781 RepID=A0A165H3L9_EXIGL|nr:hypothetical protein EXIGLDRAFT_96959 [Exidia glandulosa HHB12029]